MKRFKSFALDHPFLFGIVLLLVYAVIVTITYPLHYLFPENDAGQIYADSTAKLITFLVFLLILWRFGWIDLSGITRLGDTKIWPIVGIVLVYMVLAQLYAFTGDMSIHLSNTKLSAANLILALATSLIEETWVRGLVLIAMMLAWGSSRKGQLKAILFSSMIFGLVHLMNIMIRPVGVVLFQAIVVFLPGIFYAAIVLASRSLWPAILIHWLGNAAVNIKLVGIENYQETLTMWILFAIALMPILVYSAYLIRRLPQTDEIYAAATVTIHRVQKESVSF